MTERWLPVRGLEGLYEVSDLARVRRVGKAAVNGKGRARVGPNKDFCTVHRERAYATGELFA